MRNAFIQQLFGLATEDDRIMLITGDLGFSVLDRFAKELPDQFLNVGVAEQNMTGIAAGLALSGRMVFTYSIGNFPTLRCLEQLRNDVCYHRANVKVVAVGGGFSYGPLGFSHHATEDLAILRALPEMTVLAPGDRWEAQGATTALAGKDGPGYLRLDHGPAEPTHEADDKFVLGRARMIRDGSDATLVACGGVLGEAIRAAEALSTQGIECRVLSFHTLKPFDVDAISDAVAATSCIVTIEEHSVIGGLAGAVAEACLENGTLPESFVRLGLRDEFSTIVGSQAYLRSHYGIDATGIESAVVNALRSPAGRKLKSL